MPKFFKNPAGHSPRKFEIFWSSYFQNIIRTRDLRNPSQKNLDNTLDKKGTPPKPVVYVLLSWSLLLKILQTVECRLAMLAQGLYYEY